MGADQVKQPRLMTTQSCNFRDQGLYHLVKRIGQSAWGEPRTKAKDDEVCCYVTQSGLWPYTYQVCGALLAVDKETVTRAATIPALIDAGLPNYR